MRQQSLPTLLNLTFASTAMFHFFGKIVDFRPIGLYRMAESFQHLINSPTPGPSTAGVQLEQG